MKHISFIIIAVFLFTACIQKEQKDTDPLPSWNESPIKNAIIDFVKATTDLGRLF